MKHRSSGARATNAVSMEWNAWQLMLLVLPFMALVVACSQARNTHVTQPTAPTCDSLLGKPVTASVAETGCTDNGTTWAIAGFDCSDGSTLWQWGRWYANPAVRHYNGATDPAYVAAYHACMGQSEL